MNTAVHANIRLKLIEKASVVPSNINLSLPIYAPSYYEKETRTLKPGLDKLYAKLVQHLPNYLVLKVPAYNTCHFRKPRYDLKVIDTIPADDEIYKNGFYPDFTDTSIKRHNMPIRSVHDQTKKVQPRV